MTKLVTRKVTILLLGLALLGVVATGGAAALEANEEVDEGTVNITLEPVDKDAPVDSEVTYDVVVEGADNGMNSYEITVDLDDIDTAEITDAELVDFGGQFGSVEIADDGSSVLFEEAMGDGTEQTEFTIGEITVSTGEQEGTTELSIADDAEIADIDSQSYDIETTDSTLTVEEEPTSEIDIGFDPVADEAPVGSDVTYDIVVEGANNDISGYDFTVAVDNVDIAEITDGELVAFGGELGDVSIAEDGSSVSFEEAVGEQNVGEENFTIATVTLSTGEQEGETVLSVVDDAEIQDNDGDEYAITPDTANVTVTEAPSAPDVTGDGNPATDTTGDGLYNDVDGDGEFTVFDVQALFQHRNSDAVQENVELFDFTGDGDVTVFDAQELFNQFRNQR